MAASERTRHVAESLNLQLLNANQFHSLKRFGSGPILAPYDDWLGGIQEEIGGALARGSRKKPEPVGGDLPALKKGRNGLYPCPHCRKRAIFGQDLDERPFALCGNPHCPIMPSTDPADSVEEVTTAWNAYSVETFKQFLMAIEEQLPENVRRKAKAIEDQEWRKKR